MRFTGHNKDSQISVNRAILRLRDTMLTTIRYGVHSYHEWLRDWPYEARQPVVKHKVPIPAGFIPEDECVR